MIPAWVIAAALTLTANDVGGSAAPVEALVLGLRAPDRTLETVFIDAASVTALGRGLAVPRKAGWWKVDVLKTRSPIQPLALAAAPAGRKLALYPMFPGPGMSDCGGENEITVHYVGPEWISFENAGHYECEGDLRPSISIGAVTRPLGELALPPDRQDPGDPFAAAIGPEVSKAVDRQLPAVVAGAGSPCPPEDARVVAIVRHRGRWAFQAEGSNGASVCRGDINRFVLDVPVPALLVGHDALPQAYERHAAERPDLVDALASPSGALSVLVTPAGIEVRASERSPVLHALSGRTVVMAQWAVGTRNVERWRRDAAARLQR